jgi:hypothetical protein
LPSCQLCEKEIVALKGVMVMLDKWQTKMLIIVALCEVPNILSELLGYMINLSGPFLLSLHFSIVAHMMVMFAVFVMTLFLCSV